MSLREVIQGAVQSSEAGRHLAETGIQNITDSVIEGLQASGAEGIAEFAKLALIGAPKKVSGGKRRPVAKKAATKAATTKTDRSANKAKGIGSAVRGAVARVMRGEPRGGDEKLLRSNKDRALVFADRLGKTAEQKKLIANIVSGEGRPAGFPTVES